MTETPQPLNHFQILIVEDEALEAYLLSNCFKLEGYQVCELAARGEDAIRIAHEQAPDIIIMDNGLSGNLTGLETAIKIREFSAAPILFLTGYLGEELLNHIEELAPVSYLIKPVRVTEVLEQINNLLED